MAKKRLFGWALILFAGAAAVATHFMPGTEAPDTVPRDTASAGASAPPARASDELALPSREGFGQPRGNPFASDAPPRPPAKKQAPVEVAAPAPPEAPPMPYRIAGRFVREGEARTVLARGDRVFFVSEGDVLDGGYRVESITAEGVTLVYTPLDMRQHLAVSSPAAQPPQAAAQPPQAAAGASAGPSKVREIAERRPAEVRWEGPAQVQAGNDFEVALKVTSDQPVRGSPLNISYDAKLLEPVSVRAGAFFADGSFNYEVKPGGSISVGASGKGEVPADAEFLVVRFRPIRAGATAELKLSSLLLQGPDGGSPVGHQPLASFRTSITQ